MADKALQSLTFQGLGDTYVNTPLSTAPTFNAATAYAVGDHVFYNRKLYKFIFNHSAGNWDSSQVQEVTIGNEIKEIENGLNDKYEKPASGIPASDLASGVVPDVSGKADKVQNATSGNFASLDANGNLADSGHKHSDYLTEAPVTDVQIIGTSILNGGVANIPLAGGNTVGVVKINNRYGININQNSGGYLFLHSAGDAELKAGSEPYRAVTPYRQHLATFYGLAKAAGDITQSASSNAIGTYTDEAKVAIKSMLGVNDVVTDVTVSGTTPVITAVANTRYICGEVATLDFTPSSTGICDVIFESGSTATVLTLPSTVKMPEWFDATALEADTIYEISIVDGVYGAVMSWQA